MAMIKWDGSFSVGVKLIDGQHKKLFAILNKVEEGAGGGKESDPDFLEGVIYDLHAYVKFHFGEEEKYFAEFKYEAAEAHKAEHQFFINKVQEFHRDFMKGDQAMARGLLSFIEGWISKHIKIEDKKYSKCFREHGLK